MTTSIPDGSSAADGLTGLFRALWSSAHGDLVAWCQTAVRSGQLARFDVAEAKRILATPPQSTKDSVARLRLLAQTLLDLQEYRLQALAWQAGALRGMDPKNVHLRLLEAYSAVQDWSGAIVSGGYLLSHVEARPYWLKLTRTAVTGLLSVASPPIAEALSHVLRHTGLRFIQEVLNRFADHDPVPALLACDLTEADLLQLSVLFGHRGHVQHAIRCADALAEIARDPVNACLAHAARASARGARDAIHAALDNAPPPPDHLPSMVVWNWGMLAASCGHPTLPLIARRIVGHAATFAMLDVALAEMSSGADEAGSLMEALIQAGADPLGLLDVRLSVGLLLTDTEAKAAMALIDADASDRQTDRVVALTRELIDRSQLSLVDTLAFCRRHFTRLSRHKIGAGLLARVLTMAQDWEGSLLAWDAVLSEAPDTFWALARAYFAAARLGRPELAQSYMSRIDRATNGIGAAYVVVAHGACILGDFDVGRRILDRVQPETLKPDAANLAGRLRAVLTGDGRGMASSAPADLGKPANAPPPRVLVIDPGFSKLTGHHFAYSLFATRFFAAELNLDPAQVRVCAHRGDWLGDTGDADQIRPSLHPSFDFNPYGFEDFPKTTECLKNLARAWQSDLTNGLQSTDLSEVKVVYFHSMKANLVMGFANWVAEQFHGRRVCVIIGVIEVDYLSEGEDVSRVCHAAYNEAIRTLRAVPGLTLTFYAETTFACTNLSNAVQNAIPVHNIPYLAASLAGPAAATHVAFSRDRVTVGLVGGSRPERGLDIFPELMLALSDRSDLHWVLQMSRTFAAQLDPVFPVYLDWAVSQGICTWFEDRIETDAYYAALRAMDVVLMPYRDRYAMSGSGVFYESLQLERYLIVPEATFMHDVLVEWDYPCAFVPAPTVSAVHRLLVKILKDRAKLRTAMMALREKQGDMLPLGRFRKLLAEGLTGFLPRPAFT